MGPRQARRSSGRHRTAVGQYTSDAFEAAGLNSNGQNSGRPSARQRGIAADSDEEFTLDAEDARGTPNHDDDGELGEGSSEDEPGPDEETGAAPKRRRKNTDIELNEPTHFRGLSRFASHGSKFMQMKFTFGSGSQDLLPMIRTRENWSGALDATFPSRESIKQSACGPSYGSGATFGVETNLLEAESSKGWDWYYSENAGAAFKNHQRLKRMGNSEGRKYLPHDKDTEHTVLVGPADGQKAYKLKAGQVFNFGEAWKDKPKKKGRPKKTQDATTGEAGADGSTRSGVRVFQREGWILNLGDNIQTLSWAPNCSGEQFLAVSVRATDQRRNEFSNKKSSAAPAFTQSPPYPAAIQIWSFRSHQGDGLSQLDMEVEPRLRLVLCSDSGDISHLCWCPMTRERRPEDDNEDAFNVGLLAGIWGDGTVKVLDVSLSRKADDVEWMRIESPVFEAKPPYSLCTCLTWLSPSDIAVGCANGFVGIWSLCTPAAEEEDTTVGPKPYLYIQMQSTYVVSIAAAYPSFPHMIATADAGGQGRMMSLLDPVNDSVESLRLRLGSANIVYSPILRSFVSVGERGSIRVLPLRRFFTSVSAFKPDTAVSVISPSSFHHPIILAGNEAGTVAASNPLRRLLSSKEKLWQQTWFSHEWVPGKQQPGTLRNGQPPQVGGGGVSKFYDGFKAETSLVSSSVAGNTGPSTTTFEERTGIVALAWNPNQQCSGWACAGLGCGLVRVEDLSV